MEKIMDLFECSENQPEELKEICEYYNDIDSYKGLEYRDCEAFRSEVEMIGYTFDFGLNAVPYNLRKI